ncbi:hypothetical protein QTP88_003665 [Uroleucon formosanum]
MPGSLFTLLFIKRGHAYTLSLNKTNTLCVAAAAAALLPIINNATKTSITPSHYAAADHSAPRSFARALAISLGRRVTQPVSWPYPRKGRSGVVDKIIQ